jgi:hypothetical protein
VERDFGPLLHVRSHEGVGADLRVLRRFWLVNEMIAIEYVVHARRREAVGRARVDDDLDRTIAIGIRMMGTNTPISIAKPPRISVAIVRSPSRWGEGTPNACNRLGKASNPRSSFAKPCSINPYPTMRRSGIEIHDLNVSVAGSGTRASKSRSRRPGGYGFVSRCTKSFQ